MSHQKDTLAGSHRSVVAGTDRGSGFFVEFGAHESATKQLKPLPKRLQGYEQSKKISSADLMEKQRQAELRKKKHDEQKVINARRVREEAEKYDKKMRSQLPPNQRSTEEGRKWYSQALPKK